MAELVAKVDDDIKPWLTLRGQVMEWRGDPFAPVVAPHDIEALK